MVPEINARNHVTGVHRVIESEFLAQASEGLLTLQDEPILQEDQIIYSPCEFELID
jgi:hypothetical protein